MDFTDPPAPMIRNHRGLDGELGFITCPVHASSGAPRRMLGWMEEGGEVKR